MYEGLSIFQLNIDRIQAQTKHWAGIYLSYVSTVLISLLGTKCSRFFLNFEILEIFQSDLQTL